MTTETERLRRLRAARGTGRVPADLLPWLLELATSASPQAAAEAPSPAERLAVRVSAEVDTWMTRRGVSHRTIGCARRSLVRVLKGQNVNLATVADVADALDCEVVVTLRPRQPASEVAPLQPQVAPLRPVRQSQAYAGNRR